MTLASTGVAAPTLIIMSEVQSSAKLKTPPTGVSSLSSSTLTVLPRMQNLCAALTKGSSIWHPAVWTPEKRANFAGNVYHAIQTPKWSSRQRYAVQSALLEMEAIEEADWPQIKMVIQQAVEGAEESVCTCYVM